MCYELKRRSKAEIIRITEYQNTKCAEDLLVNFVKIYEGRLQLKCDGTRCDPREGK